MTTRASPTCWATAAASGTTPSCSTWASSSRRPPSSSALSTSSICWSVRFDRRKEGNVLFNDALNTFYLRLYGVRHMVKNHSDSERGNLLLPYRLQGFFYMHHPTDRITHTTAFVTPFVDGEHSFTSLFHDWCNKTLWYLLSCLWDYVYKRTLGRKEGNVLFNNALNTFYLRLYGVGHMIKDNSESERENMLPPHRLLFPISCKGSFICIIPQTG